MRIVAVVTVELYLVLKYERVRFSPLAMALSAPPYLLGRVNEVVEEAILLEISIIRDLVIHFSEVNIVETLEGLLATCE